MSEAPFIPERRKILPGRRCCLDGFRGVSHCDLNGSEKHDGPLSMRCGIITLIGCCTPTESSFCLFPFWGYLSGGRSLYRRYRSYGNRASEIRVGCKMMDSPSKKRILTHGVTRTPIVPEHPGKPEYDGNTLLSRIIRVFGAPSTLVVAFMLFFVV